MLITALAAREQERGGGWLFIFKIKFPEVAVASENAKNDAHTILVCRCMCLLVILCWFLKHVRVGIWHVTESLQRS